MFCLFPLFAQERLPQTLGEITQIEGTVTFLQWRSGAKVQEVKKGDFLWTEGSFLTHDDGYFSAKLLGDSFIKTTPETKFALDYHPQEKKLTINLFTGSLKILISQHKKSHFEKIIVKGADASFEASDAKFSVVRSPLLNSLSVYVQKGVVTTSRGEANQLVHANETSTINEKTSGIPSPRNIQQKELKFLEQTFQKDK